MSGSYNVLVSVDSSGCGLPTGAIVGIAIGCFLLALGIVVAVVILHRRSVQQFDVKTNAQIRQNNMVEMQDQYE